MAELTARGPPRIGSGLWVPLGKPFGAEEA